MTYLVFQMILLMLACAALGFFLAWLIWGWRRAEMMELAASDRVLFHDAAAEVEGLQAQLATLEGERAAAVSKAEAAHLQIAEAAAAAEHIEGESATAHREVGRLRRELAECAQARASADAALSAARSRIAALETEVANGQSRQSAPVSAPAPRANGASSRAGFADLSSIDAADKPPVMTEPPAGGGDDLKRISGVGRKLEGVLKQLGVYTFQQIAAWSDKEIAWVDEHLKFRGRIQRDNWIEQARLLAEGGETEFSKRVDKGGIYE